MRRCIHFHTNRRRCWAAAFPGSLHCDIHAPEGAEHSLADVLREPMDKYHAAMSFIENYWKGESLFTEDFLEASEILMALAEEQLVLGRVN